MKRSFSNSSWMRSKKINTSCLQYEAHTQQLTEGLLPPYAFWTLTYSLRMVRDAHPSSKYRTETTINWGNGKSYPLTKGTELFKKWSSSSSSLSSWMSGATCLPVPVFNIQKNLFEGRSRFLDPISLTFRKSCLFVLSTCWINFPYLKICPI
jgi:hypothetical protein